jgi:hypothetical protein
MRIDMALNAIDRLELVLDLTHRMSLLDDLLSDRRLNRDATDSEANSAQTDLARLDEIAEFLIAQHWLF